MCIYIYKSTLLILDFSLAIHPWEGAWAWEFCFTTSLSWFGVHYIYILNPLQALGKHLEHFFLRPSWNSSISMLGSRELVQIIIILGIGSSDLQDIIFMLCCSRDSDSSSSSSFFVRWRNSQVCLQDKQHIMMSSCHRPSSSYHYHMI